MTALDLQQNRSSGRGTQRDRGAEPGGVALPMMRVGLPETTGYLPIAAEQLDVPVLVSASRLWNKKRERFRAPGFAINELDCALDSAGFTVMKDWGGVYPWRPEQYVRIGVEHEWAWYSQPDYCVEPDIAEDAQAVALRVRASATMLARTRVLAEGMIRTWCADYVLGLRKDFSALSPCVSRRSYKMPMPVLQGWRPDDYRLSVALVGDVLRGRWPSMVGVGSMCRRHVHGELGILAVLDVLDEVLPEGVVLHLFGLKGSAIPHLGPYLHRVVSLDSMAWDYAARQQRRAGHKPDDMRPLAFRAQHMERWVKAQDAHLDTLRRKMVAAALLEQARGEVSALLPPDISSADLAVFLDDHGDTLRGQLADALPRQIPTRHQTVQ